MDREPSFLEVLYPPKQRGTKTYIPPFAPPVEKVSECEKLCGVINGVLKGLAMAFCLFWGLVALIVLLLLGG